MKLNSEKPKGVEVSCRDMLRIDPDGAVTRSSFDASSFCWSWPFAAYPCFRYDRRGAYRPRNAFEREYLDELKAVVASFGYTAEYIDDILASGFTSEDVEEMLYCGYL